MSSDALAFLAMPFLACLVLVGIHAYLGIHVLARGVIFVDIALAQIAALGTTVAFLSGHSLDGPIAYLYSLGFTFVGAVIFALSRHVRGRVPQEALIGITYVVAAASAIVFVDKAPHGAEHIKYLLVGNILWVTPEHVGVIAGLYSLLGVFHFVCRKQFLRLSFEGHGAAPEAEPPGAGDAKARAKVHLRDTLWDLLFYVSFGFVITSSVQVAGVLLVFSFLIVPAVFAALFTQRLGLRLVLSWSIGFVVSVVGIAASYFLDLPTGAAVVTTFGAVLAASLLGRTVLRTFGVRIGPRPAGEG